MDKKFEKFSFSTAWNWRNSNNGRSLINEIRELGFRNVELNYKVTREMLETIVPMVEHGEIKVSSVHNVFPFVDDKCYNTDSLLLGYPNEQRRKHAVGLTKTSIDYGESLGAKAVVIHPTQVPVSPRLNYGHRLEQLYRAGKRETEEYKKLFLEMLSHRNPRSKRYTDLAIQSLEELCDYVEQKGYKIKLGIENRIGLTQIPDLQEMHYILEQMHGSPVYFWYDVGHGIALDALGLFDNFNEVQHIKNKIIGMHIHDCVGIDDHYAPYARTDVLDKFLPIIKAAPIKVLELGPKNSPEDIIAGTELLAQKLEQLNT